MRPQCQVGMNQPLANRNRVVMAVNQRKRSVKKRCLAAAEPEDPECQKN